MFLKRLFDIVMSIIGIIIFFPVMIVVAILIKATSKGPVIFSQRRLTKGIKEFTLYKFRSIDVDFDKENLGIRMKGKDDAITPIGKIIRRTKLDELPQLFNVLLGDMSFIGPRPEVPERLKYYSERDKKIFEVRSGISSPASIVFSDEEYLMSKADDPEKFYIEKIMPYKIDLNLYYIENRSFLNDIFLIIVTIVKIIKNIDNKLIIKDKDLLDEKKKIEESVKKY